MKLADLATVMERRRGGLSLEDFCTDSMIASLRWPDDVVEQFLYDHGDNSHFLHDYRDIDFSRVVWGLEATTAEELSEMPTGASDDGCIEEYAANPDHWVAVRRTGIHEGVARCWETLGTWKRAPILIDRRLLDPSESGLQVVEGRTRVGVLRGRRRQGSFVAVHHEAWVGRPSMPAASSRDES
ncbi:hypothetical protein [Streptomyces sp. NBC_00989]|uniref:hypothetical protein n=1 Tax=Streptomyces sp. NBC_00989 TaxID=2903705 RepID=UPI00386B81E6|nr:hypothetical protein OG714_54215 [Streptomyces sp. NBC_00989]